MKKIWSDKAWEQYLELSVKDKVAFKKINDILRSIDRNGYECIGKPEPLKENYSSYWSTRIDKKNRLIFKITDLGIEIISCYSHYEGN